MRGWVGTERVGGRVGGWERERRQTRMNIGHIPGRTRARARKKVVFQLLPPHSKICPRSFSAEWSEFTVTKSTLSGATTASVTAATASSSNSAFDMLRMRVCACRMNVQEIDTGKKDSVNW